MDPWRIFKKQAIDLTLNAISKLDLDYEITIKNLKECINYPAKATHGDLSLVLYELSKKINLDPEEFAKKIETHIAVKGYISHVKASRGYLNFYLKWDTFTRDVLKEAVKPSYGRSDLGHGKLVIIDYSSPNIAKPFLLHHLRSTVIGDSLYRIHKWLGYHCIGDNHIGDWGAGFGALLAAYKLWGSKEKIELNPIEELYNLYVRFHRESKGNPKLQEMARKWAKKLEDGDPEAVNLWKWFRNESLKEFQKVYSMLGVKFDLILGESFYVKLAKEVVKEALSKGVAVRESDGSVVVKLEEYGLPNFLIQKKDGTTLYSTRDLATAIYRYNEYNFDKCLYVVAREQKTYFKQLFKTLQLLGYDWFHKCEHVSFGLLMYKGKKMGTRTGSGVKLNEIIKELREKANNIMKDREGQFTREEKDKIVQAISVGALKFSQLKASREDDITFDKDMILELTGDTAPYIQYAHARCCSILRKAGKHGTGDPSLLIKPVERQIIKLMSQFPEIIEKTINTMETHYIPRYLLKLTSTFSSFYSDTPVLNAKPVPLRDARLSLISCVKNVLKIGLWLLGIEAPEKI